MPVLTTPFACFLTGGEQCLNVNGLKAAGSLKTACLRRHASSLKAMAALEAQRPILGDAVVETAVAPIREKLAALVNTGAPSLKSQGERKFEVKTPVVTPITF